MPAPGPTALIDAVDERNEPVALVRRSEVFAERANFRTVHVLVFNSAGEVLLQLVGRGGRHPGLWGSSAAGYLHAGESYEEAARRRVREELGLATPLDEVGVLAMVDQGVTKFIGVFTTVADRASIELPEHTAQLEFRSLRSVRRDSARSPEGYTESLREVLLFAGEVRGGRAPAG